jgi:CheY-like chemotaxis protein
MNGFETTQLIRKQELALYGGNRRIPIVAISADSGNFNTPFTAMMLPK